MSEDHAGAVDKRHDYLVVFVIVAAICAIGFGVPAWMAQRHYAHKAALKEAAAEVRAAKAEVDSAASRAEQVEAEEELRAALGRLEEMRRD